MVPGWKSPLVTPSARKLAVPTSSFRMSLTITLLAVLVTDTFCAVTTLPDGSISSTGLGPDDSRASALKRMFWFQVCAALVVRSPKSAQAPSWLARALMARLPRSAWTSSAWVSNSAPASASTRDSVYCSALATTSVSPPAASASPSA